MKLFSVGGQSLLDSYPILPFTRAPSAARNAQWDFTAGQLPERCTFSRASGASDLVDGLMNYVASDVPRLSASGILIEPQRTNIFLYSTMTGNQGGYPNGWGSGGVSGGGGVPVASQYGNADGAVAWSFTASNTRVFIAPTSFPVLANTTYTYSALIESNPNNLVAKRLLQFINIPSGAAWTYEKSNGEFVPVAGERVSMTLSVGATSGTALTRFGVGVDIATTGTVIMSRPQMEVNVAKASSYIPTNTTAVTRAADQLSLDIPAGIASLLYTFDDDSTQELAAAAGDYMVPTNLNRPIIKRITGVA